ncbi:hypothetical protein DFH06DRAFT_1324123 [Mycena polygramma]|nr:hypothetical protein DFH06DRAFT_1324123 [Mycena polygramma]
MFNLKLAALVAAAAVSATAMSLDISSRQQSSQGGELYACEGGCFTESCGNISFDVTCTSLNLPGSTAPIMSWRVPAHWSCTISVDYCNPASNTVTNQEQLGSFPGHQMNMFLCRYNASQTAAPTSSAVCYTDYGTITPTIPPSTSTTGSVLGAGRRSMGYMDIDSEGESDLAHE